MIIGARHTGLVVRDIERSLSFYQGLLGLSVVSRKKESCPYIETVVGIPGAALEWVKLKSADEYHVELIQYSPDGQSSSEAGNARSDKQGCSHIAFTVRDIDTVYNKLQSKGCHCNSKPQTSPDGLARVMYCHDPDGIIIEFVEEIKTV